MDTIVTKATQKQYEEAVDIYSKYGADGVFMFAIFQGINSWSDCEQCACRTPDTENNECLCCGITK